MDYYKPDAILVACAICCDFHALHDNIEVLFSPGIDCHLKSMAGAGFEYFSI